MEKYTVTGSLLPAVEGESYIPVTTYSSAKLLLLGAATPIEGLRSLPSFFGATSTELDSNGGSGAATVNLRGLGGTLTLINGRRSFGFADLNLIPIDAVQNIDILKDGAGAVYGADALAGVVNVVLKKKWVGTQVRLGYGISSEGDSQQWDASVAIGRAFDKGYLTVVAGYSDKDTLYARERALSANADGRIFGGQNGGSPTFPGHIGGAASGLLLKSSLQFGQTPADYLPFNPSTESFNFRLFSPSIPGQTRKLAHLAGGYEIFDRRMEAYVEFDYADSLTANGLAPAPFALPSATARNSRYNPWGAGVTIPGATVRYRGVDLDIRRNSFDKQDYRYVIGLQGKFDNGWGYDTGFMQSHESLLQTEANGILRSKIVAATDNGSFNPFARAGTTGTFRGFSWDNHTSLGGALTAGHKPSTGVLDAFDFKLFGPAMKLPAGQVQLAIGYQHLARHDTFNPENIYFAGDLLGYNSGNPFDASGKNDAFYGEVDVPIISASDSITGVSSLSLNGNVREDNAKVKDNITGDAGSFGSFTKRIGLRYQPTSELVLRASYGTGFRVPDLGSLYAAPGDNFPTLTDPLRFPIGQQTDVLTQGNPNLGPESSVNKALGMIYSPKWAPGFNVTIDYYKTTLGGLITDGAQFILNQNAATQGAGFPIITRNSAGVITSVVTDPNALYAARIHRHPVTGEIDDQSGPAIDSTNLNVAVRAAEGLDYTFSYRQPKGSWGQFTHTLEFNQVLSWSLIPEAGSPVQEWKGRFVDPASNAIAPGSIPAWKGYYNLLWESGNWTASATMNYTHSVLDDPTAQFFDEPTQTFLYLDPATNTIKKQNGIPTMERYITFDLTVSYKFTDSNKWMKGTEVRLGVQNIGNEPPPFSAGAFNDNYDTSMYSTRGRFYQFGVTQKF